MRKGSCLALKGPNRFLTEHHREKQFKPQHEKGGASAQVWPDADLARFSPLCILDPRDGTAGGLANHRVSRPCIDEGWLQPPQVRPVS